MEEKSQNERFGLMIEKFGKGYITKIYNTGISDEKIAVVLETYGDILTDRVKRKAEDEMNFIDED